MKSDPFRPITRATAAEILEISLGTLDRHVRDGDLPPPRPFGSGRKLYWLPEEFYASLHDGLLPRPDEAVSSLRGEQGAQASVRRSRASSSTCSEPATARAARYTTARIRRLNQ
jgi:predicted DNA-binding transcriptional regulator AlpA